MDVLFNPSADNFARSGVNRSLYRAEAISASHTVPALIRRMTGYGTGLVRQADADIMTTGARGAASAFVP
jgi:hypothetical protein